MRLTFYLGYLLAGGLALAAATFGVLGVSPTGHFQQRLLELQRQGSCADLPQFGVNTHRGRNPDEVNVSLISQVGARMVRLEIPWIDLERHNQFNFSPFDHLVNKLRENRKSIVFGLAYGHPDHSDGRATNGFPLPPRTPEQREAYGRYAQAVAKQYHGPDIVYEIWNEPNLAGFWPPTPDVKAYGALLAETAKAIREVKPAATIISGGLANEHNPPQFLNELAQAGALGGLDGIAFHPYRTDAPEKSLHDMSEFEAAAIPFGNPPLWITEWGYSDSWLAKSASGRVGERSAAMMARLMLTAALAKAKVVLVYDLIDDGTDPNDQESHFGLYDYDFKPKQAATAFRTLAGLMSDCNKYEFAVDPARNMVTAAFHFDGMVSYVVWTYATGYSRDICLAVPDLRPTDLKDISGNPLPLEQCVAASQVRLRIAEVSGPLILQGESTSTK
jgi:hypothetical protein